MVSTVIKLVTLLAGIILLAALSGPSRAQSDPFAGRPGLADAESEPSSIATCENLKNSLMGFREPTHRVDLWVAGPLTLVHSDGVLSYLVICSAPGVRVMCVTYSNNGMQVGERVMFKGAFSRQDERHISLDPCLASRA